MDFRAGDMVRALGEIPHAGDRVGGQTRYQGIRGQPQGHWLSDT